LNNDIAVIAPDKELMSLLETLQKDFSEPFTMALGFLEEAIPVGRQLRDLGAKVLVSRGGTTTILRNCGINLPIIDIPITEYDAIRLLDEARQIADRIAVIGFDTLVQAATTIAPILGVTVDTFRVRSDQDVVEAIQEIKTRNIPVVVGAKLAVELSQAAGLKGILLRSPRNTVLAALKEAFKVADALRRERETGERLQVILDSIQEGIISIDKDGKITHFNRPAKKILDMAAPFEWPKDDETGIYEAVQASKRWIGEIREFSGEKYVCNMNPIVVNKDSLGAVLVLQELNSLQRLEQNVRRNLHQKGLTAKFSFDDILTQDPAMRNVIEKGRHYSGVDATILIQGLSGTGKEMFAQSIHRASARGKGPFVAINCAVLPEHLLESELFGYAEGAFTGAKKGGKSGLFELAHGGTLFLDEIGEISAAVQASLLRVLEERKIMRIGDDKVIPVDVRVICATNRDLKGLLEAGQFRADLYYRINILKVELPSLDHRKADIPLLADHFLETFARGHVGGRPTIDAEAMSLLAGHDWPGNIRELRNVMERLSVVSSGQTVTVKDILNVLDAPPRQWPDAAPKGEKKASLVHAEEFKLIREVLEKTGGNKAWAARLLGLSKTTLWRRLKAGGPQE
jgi:transcriptional regulator with PAS, ATPase and Fis domain